MEINLIEKWQNGSNYFLHLSSQELFNYLERTKISTNQQEEKQQCGLQFETKGNCQGLENEGKQLLLQEECRGISSQCDLKIPGMTFSLG